MDEKIEKMYQKFLYYKFKTKAEDFSYKGMCEHFYRNGYRKESDTVKEVLQKVLKFTLDDEVGMRYLVKNLAREYGVELKQEKKYDSVKKKISRA